MFRLPTTLEDFGVLKLSLEALCEYTTFLFDADGVLWTGNNALPGAVEFVNHLLDNGKTVYIVSNNATRTIKDYTVKVQNLGFKRIKEENIVTPTVVLVDYMTRHPAVCQLGIYLIGSPALRDTLREKLKCIVYHDEKLESDEFNLSSVDVSTPVSSVVVGFDGFISYKKIMKAANYLKNPIVGFFVTNEDGTFPSTTKTVIPGTGVMTAAIRAAVAPRLPLVCGKPSMDLDTYLLLRCNVRKESTIMFGDRLDTDIKFANVHGYDSCYVETGVHTVRDICRAQEDGQHELVPKFTCDFATLFDEPKE